MSSPPPTGTPTRRACHGSCHCGFTRYIVYLTLPHPFSSTNPPHPDTDQEIYRCNCTTCHKLGLLHVHPAHPRRDFVLLSPLDPDAELGVYRVTEGGRLKFYFCPRCGVRCFTFGGEGGREVVDVDVDLAELGLPGEDGKDAAGGKQREVWRAKWDGRPETRPYVSVNGTSIDHREDFDIRVLTEEKRVQYFDDLSEPAEKKKEPRWERPHYGGCY